MAKETLIAGVKTRETYTPIDTKDCVGKTVEAVIETWVPSPWGPEKCIRLHFADGTTHGFVVPTDDEDRPSNEEAGLECGVCGGVDEACVQSPDGTWKCADPDPSNPEDLTHG